jgi:hypothetical protein
MAQLPPIPTLPPPRDDYDTRFQAALNNFLQKVVDLFHNGSRLTDNHAGEDITYTSNATPDTEDTIPHTLKRVPTKVILVSTDKFVNLRSGATAWTATNLYLKADVASAAVTLYVE